MYGVVFGKHYQSNFININEIKPPNMEQQNLMTVPVVVQSLAVLADLLYGRRQSFTFVVDIAAVITLSIVRFQFTWQHGESICRVSYRWGCAGG